MATITAERIKEIKTTIQALKEKKARSEGAMKGIEEGWKKQFDFSTVEKAEKKLTELNEEIEISNTRLNKLGEEIEDAAEWDDFE